MRPSACRSRRKDLRGIPSSRDAAGSDHARPRGSEDRGRPTRKAAYSNLGPLTRVARVSNPDFEETIQADERPTVTALTERSKQHISMTVGANRDRQGSTLFRQSLRRRPMAKMAQHYSLRDTWSTGSSAPEDPMGVRLATVAH